MSAKSIRRNAGNSSSSHAMMQPLEDRRMFAATAIKVVDTGGPISEMVEAGGQIYVASPLASGGSVLQIYATDGKTSRMLLDASQPGSMISAISELTATEDGRLFFTAGTVGGRHLFELNAATGQAQQLTTGTNKSYGNVTAAGTRLFFYENNTDTICTIAPGTQAILPVTTLLVDSDFKAAGNGTVFFIGPSESVYRSDGTAAGTVKVSGDYKVGRNDFFSTNDFVVFEGNKTGENTSLFIVGLGGTQPVRVADDFSLLNTSHAELGGWVYFSGGYYGTSPLSNGRQLYRVNANGVVELASKVPGSNDGQVEGISAIGNNVYYTARDGQDLPSQGTSDRELYRYDTLTKQTKLVTDKQTLYPIEVGAGALSSYYFVAAPDKENARFGSRALYRTNPVTDEIELVQGLPTVKDANQKPYQRVRDIAVGANGFFFEADTGDMGRDTDVFFSQTPFSRLAANGLLTIEGTDFTDFTTMRVEGSELILTQNGFEERHAVASVLRIEAFLKAGNDAFQSDVSVFVPTYVFGDVGDDRLNGGSGNDTLTGGAGRNRLYGGAGDDRINGAGGRDFLGGDAGVDRIYGNGGNDDINGGIGVDWVWAGGGDDFVRGGWSNDKIFGEDGNDTLLGDLQSDWLLGGAGNDEIHGHFGLDTIEGGDGIDALFGGNDDDTLVANDGLLDSLSGGDGIDTATVDPTEGLLDAIEVIL